MAVEQSLFEAGSGTPMETLAQWTERVMLSEMARGVCVIAVSLVGALMLTGRLALREGARIVVRCFELLVAMVVTTGFVGGGSRVFEPAAPSLC